mmetsp:Transcript_41988/g.88191  ORF Transcript_41988/g.88191 Transcript_41988/m.88191 type:complete len:86 (-) Transcript_41988:425-682(-)
MQILLALFSLFQTVSSLGSITISPPSHIISIPISEYLYIESNGMKQLFQKTNKRYSGDQNTESNIWNEIIVTTKQEKDDGNNNIE